jgi:hypothetical protein
MQPVGTRFAGVRELASSRTSAVMAVSCPAGWERRWGTDTEYARFRLTPASRLGPSQLRGFFRPEIFPLSAHPPASKSRFAVTIGA